MWSGLGYYSRGQRLWEGAKKVCNKNWQYVRGDPWKIYPLPLLISRYYVTIYCSLLSNFSKRILEWIIINLGG
jgi:hypothetical protein